MWLLWQRVCDFILQEVGFPLVFLPCRLSVGLSLAWDKGRREETNVHQDIAQKGTCQRAKPLPVRGAPQRKSWVGSEWRKDGDQEGVIMARVNRKMNVSSNIAESMRQRMRCVLGVWGLLWKLIWSSLGRWRSYNKQEWKGYGVSNLRTITHSSLWAFSSRLSPPLLQEFHFDIPGSGEDTRSRYSRLQLGKEMLSLTSKWANTSSLQIGWSGPTIHQEVIFLAK